ncbi:E3 ubiquitin-protein ligase RNF14 [Triticum urartu]|uniref:RBR-type E3 ubiquitin transferase n=1 Tax=Triticum urartu TaxID=4572 RepID=M7ZA73_TRIUA|nr:E3 ubiquitin-protein ligase RNF14 [Triticum urartu]
MPLAGIVSSSAAAFLLLFVLLAEGQPAEGLMAKNRSEAFLAPTEPEVRYCYHRSITEELGLGAVPTSKTRAIPADTHVPTPPALAPPAAETGLSWRAKAWCCWVLAVATVVVGVVGRGGLFAWCCWVLAVATVVVVFVVRPETFLVSPRIDGMFITDDGEGDPPVDGNEHTTMGMDAVPDILKASVDSSETRRERGSSPMPRPQPRDPMLIADSNGDSPVDGRGELFYCPMCMETAPIILKSRFGSCDDHVFCSSCVAKYVAVKQLQDVALPVECPDCEDDPSLNSDGEGNEDSPADGNGKRRFYCAKCMHVVPCACVRPGFSSCAHDLCSSCVSRQLQGRRRQAGKLPRHQPADLLPKPKGNGDLPVDVDGELFDCAICMELVPGTLKFRVNSCAHAFCSSCVAQYIAAKLDDKVARIECPHPGCEEGAVEPESCHGIIPTDLLDKWGLLLCELAVGAKRMYCPYRECSALLLADSEAGAAAIAEAECPHCHRLFCARCAVPGPGGCGCEVWIQLLLPMRIRVVRAKPLLQQVQALISTVWLAMEGRFLPPTTT